jgi:hypothetical protein
MIGAVDRVPRRVSGLQSCGSDAKLMDFNELLVTAVTAADR